MHLAKNCRKYAPEQVDPNKPDWWFPDYAAGSLSFRLDDISSNECPVALITSDSKWLVQMLNRNHTAHRSCGAAMFGLDSALWPAWWADAVAAAQRMTDLEEAALAAERRTRK